MHKFTEKLKKMYHSPNFPFFLFLLLLIILHVKILHVNGDDIYFSNILQETNQGLFGYLQMRYTTWTSRILFNRRYNGVFIKVSTIHMANSEYRYVSFISKIDI